ncbi:hypothetical protein ATO49_06720 [Mycolicibacterium fortuitum subsp. fortuitum DSM 46621 = ATCC 6841 = JCM 6387]|nr:hypothetical protein ATO49_06720 [Mycolicibacterium fortuitum subsp. fortuitum DSM 46621 = ATCC 6841 = JCM 6387]
MYVGGMHRERVQHVHVARPARRTGDRTSTARLVDHGPGLDEVDRVRPEHAGDLAMRTDPDPRRRVGGPHLGQQRQHQHGVRTAADGPLATRQRGVGVDVPASVLCGRINRKPDRDVAQGATRQPASCTTDRVESIGERGVAHQVPKRPGAGQVGRPHHRTRPGFRLIRREPDLRPQQIPGSIGSFGRCGLLDLDEPVPRECLDVHHADHHDAPPLTGANGFPAKKLRPRPSEFGARRRR